MRKLVLFCFVLVAGGYIKSKIHVENEANESTERASAFGVKADVEEKDVMQVNETITAIQQEASEPQKIEERLEPHGIGEMTDRQLQDELTYLEREIELQDVTGQLNSATGKEHEMLVLKWRPIFEKLSHLRAENFQRRIEEIQNEVTQLERKHKSKDGL